MTLSDLLSARSVSILPLPVSPKALSRERMLFQSRRPRVKMNIHARSLLSHRGGQALISIGTGAVL